MIDRTYTTSTAHPVHEDALRPSALRRISWGSVLAGAVITMAVHFLLSLLGVGIGLTTLDPGQPGAGSPEPSSLGIAAGIWWVASNLIALVCGGYAAARLSGLPFRGDGILHGVLTWAVTLLITLWLLTTAVGSIMGGAFNIVQNTASAAGQGLAQIAPQVVDAAGLSVERLREQADRLLAPEQPGGMSREAARREIVSALTTIATASGQEAAQARDRAVAIIARQTGITEAQAEERIEQVQNEIEQIAAQAADAADTAAAAASSAAIWAFVAFLLGAGAGALGGAIGTRRRREYYD